MEARANEERAASGKPLAERQENAFLSSERKRVQWPARSLHLLCFSGLLYFSVKSFFSLRTSLVVFKPPLSDFQWRANRFRRQEVFLRKRQGDT